MFRLVSRLKSGIAGVLKIAVLVSGILVARGLSTRAHSMENQ